MDFPSLDTLFIVTPFKANNDLQQTMGRILRRSTDKNSPVVSFFEDKIPTVTKMLRPLKAYLRSEGINFKVVDGAKE